MLRRLAAALALLLPLSVRAAEPTHLRYAVHGSVLGLDAEVASVEADLLIQPDSYAVRLSYRTAGATSFLVPASSALESYSTRLCCTSTRHCDRSSSEKL